MSDIELHYDSVIDFLNHLYKVTNDSKILTEIELAKTSKLIQGYHGNYL